MKSRSLREGGGREGSRAADAIVSSEWPQQVREQAPAVAYEYTI